MGVYFYCYTGSLKQTQGSGCLSWQPNDSARFRWGTFCGHDLSQVYGFNAIKDLQSENTYMLTRPLRYHKHLSTS